jgi:uncharacterized repeat protein (TIGR01451 family)
MNHRRREVLRAMVYSLFLLGFLLGGSGAQVAATTAVAPVGNGTADSPYLIATIDNLYWFSQNPAQWGKHYRQTANIDASGTAVWDAGAGWLPVGYGASPFSGVYDGAGYTIDKLYINRSAEANVGLFGLVTGQIKNVGLTNVNITGQSAVGGVAGYASSASISNSYVTGSVKGSYGGGIAGRAWWATISNSYSTASVVGEYCGGLVGMTWDATISNSYAVGSVAGTNCGGLIGSIARESSVTNSFWDKESSGQASSAAGTGKSTAEMKSKTTFTAAGWDFTNTWAISAAPAISYPYLKHNAQTPPAGFGEPHLVISAIGTQKAGQAFSVTVALKDAKGNPLAVSAAATITLTLQAGSGQLIGATSGQLAAGQSTLTIAGVKHNTHENIQLKATGSGGAAQFRAALSNIFLVGPGVADAVKSTITASSTLITTSSSSIITVQLKDAYANLLTAGGDHVFLSTTHGTLTAVSDKANGTYTASLTAAVAGNATVSAYLGTDAAAPLIGTLSVGVNPVAIAPAGAGTAASPYLIASLDNLYWIGQSSDRWDKHYRQTANIDATSTRVWNSGQGWTSIGSPVSPFTGVYDGAGHTIDGLYVNRSTNSYVGGLMGRTIGGQVRNVGLTNVEVNGSTFVGGLVGEAKDATISNVYVTGSVNGYHGGGIVGWANNSTISNSYATGSVHGVWAGGLVGDLNKSTIVNSYFVGTAGSDELCGLIGTSYNSTVQQSFWDKEAASGSYSAGGTGKTTVEMKNKATFANADWDFDGTWAISEGLLVSYPYLRSNTQTPAPGLEGPHLVIGPIGKQRPGEAFSVTVTLTNGAGVPVAATAPSTITLTLATGNGALTGTTSGQLAAGQSAMTIAGLTYNTSEYVQLRATGAGGSAHLAEGLSAAFPVGGDGAFASHSKITAAPRVITLAQSSTITVQLKNADDQPLTMGGDQVYLTTTHGLLTAVNDAGDGTYTAVLSVDLPGNVVVKAYLGSDDQAPLIGQASVKVTLGAVVPAGAGTYDDPYLIANLGNLYWLSKTASVWGSHFLQTADIDASDTASWNAGAGWEPIGRDRYSPFTGVYEGAGHTINGLHIFRSLSRCIGLFGWVENGHIHDIGLTNVDITGEADVGGLAGSIRNTSIVNCYVSGNISGDYAVGGLIANANSSSTVIESYTTGSVHGSIISAGLVANLTLSAVTNSYSTAGVSSDYHSAGLVASSTYSSVINSYAVGSVAGADSGGLVSEIFGTSWITNSFWDTQATGQMTSKGGTGKTTAEMKSKATFTAAGWDFTDTWAIDTAPASYPYLQKIAHNSHPEHSLGAYPVLSPESSADLLLSLQVDEPYSQCGDLLTYTIALRNQTGSPLAEVSVTANLPQGLSYVAASSTAQYDALKGALTWSPAVLEPGMITLTFQATVDSDVPEGTLMPTEAFAYAVGRPGVAYDATTTTVGTWPQLELTKTADKDAAGIGSMVRYRVVLTNRSDVATPVASSATVVRDTLPEGFVYAGGSTKVDGAAAADPAVAGRGLSWSLGVLLPGESTVLEYATLVGLAATTSDGVNTVLVQGENPGGFAFQTHPTQARVTVQVGVFGCLGVVTGTVYLNTPDKPGLEGVAIYTDDGRQVLTDAHGRYSIPDMYPGLRSLKFIVPGAPVSRFVNVPVSGVTVVNVGVNAAAVHAVAARSADAADGTLQVGVLDVLMPQGELPYLRYGSFFGRYEVFTDWTLTLRHRLGYPAQAAALVGDVPSPQTIGDKSVVQPLDPGVADTLLRLERPGAVLLYGGFRPEEERANRYTSATMLLTGVKAQFGGVTLYGANMRGTERSVTLACLGTSGPYYLQNAPIVTSSEDIWLVTVDSENQQELDRVRLVPERDYRLDYAEGILWLTEAIPGFDARLNVQQLELTYRSGEVGVVGRLIGARIGAAEGTGPLGISVSLDQRETEDRQLIGVDGRLHFGQNGYLAYELGYSGSTTSESTAIYVQTGIPIGKRLEWRLTGERVSAALRRPDGSIQPAGTWLGSYLAYRLSDTSTLTHERRFMETDSLPAAQRDELSWQVSAGPLSLQAGLVSEAGSQQQTSARIGAGWASDQLNVLVGLAASDKNNWKVTVPASIAHRMQLGPVSAFIGYRRNVGEQADGTWVAALDHANAAGGKVYTRYQDDGETTSLVAGTSQGWSLRQGLDLTVSAEAGPNRFTGSWRLSYAPDYSGAADATAAGMQAGIGQEYTIIGGKTVQNTRLNLLGSVGESLYYRLSGYWRNGDAPAEAGRRTLRREISAAVDYRHPGLRHTVLAQFIPRSYDQSQVTVASIDWGYRLNERLAVSAKLAAKSEGLPNTADNSGITISLAQLGAEIALGNRYSLELFGRSLMDSVGAKQVGGVVEFVYAITEDIGISVGRSSLGTDDPDLRLVAPWPQGLYYRLRVKF